MIQKLLQLNPNLAALVGLLSFVPFFVLNAIITNRIEPIYSLIKPEGGMNLLEYIVLSIVLLFMPVGAYITLRPMIGKKRKVYPTNIIVIVLLLLIFSLLVFVLGSEIYVCDILRQPNCD